MLRGFVALGLLVGIFAVAIPPAAAQSFPEPDTDPFYDPPRGFPRYAAGAILRSRPITAVALGVPLPVQAWQILTRSNDTKGRPVAVVTTLMVPLAPYLGEGPRPLLSYQVAINSLGDQCNPSYSLRSGSRDGNTQTELNLIMQQAMARGWAVVTTDHEGPRNAYTAARMGAHAVLDGIRAAIRLPDTGLAGPTTPIGLMGYSGGAQARAWAAEMHPAYAPELDIKGVASGGTVADLGAGLRQIDGGAFSGLVFGAMFGIDREYPEMNLHNLLTPAGKAVKEEIGDMCVSQLRQSHQLEHFATYTTDPDPFSVPRVARVIADVRLGKETPIAPVYLYHAINDELIPIADVDTLYITWCASGGNITYHRDPASGHITLLVTGAPAAFAFLEARFAGTPVRGCQDSLR
jgi:Secretory lipase